MTKPHKHAALIKAWADGAEIEALNFVSRLWEIDRSPQWAEFGQYRVKPRPIKYWELERVAFSRGERIQWRSTCMQHADMGWLDVDPKSPAMGPAFDEPTNEFRIKPKTATTRVRVAALGEPSGEGEIWLRRVDSDEEAKPVERSKHFLCWLHEWKEIERPALDMTPPPVPRLFGGGAWFGIDPATAESDIKALLSVYGKPDQANPTKVDG